ncbi:MAG TPA: hypothetical protein PKY59_01010 [Pyrinomonadaceae bacterium]|nr:hypothetical protein [Pyrinomonadaceae bacterium]
MIFGVIFLSTFLLENIERFPSIASKLPMRAVITAKQDLELYSAEYEGGQKKAIGILKSGETAEFEMWSCPYKTIKLSNGERYKILAEENRDEIKIKLHKFYYF